MMMANGYYRPWIFNVILCPSCCDLYLFQIDCLTVLLFSIVNFKMGHFYEEDGILYFHENGSANKMAP